MCVLLSPSEQSAFVQLWENIVGFRLSVGEGSDLQPVGTLLLQTGNTDPVLHWSQFKACSDSYIWWRFPDVCLCLSTETFAGCFQQLTVTRVYVNSHIEKSSVVSVFLLFFSFLFHVVELFTADSLTSCAVSLMKHKLKFSTFITLHCFHQCFRYFKRVWNIVKRVFPSILLQDNELNVDLNMSWVSSWGKVEL